MNTVIKYHEYESRGYRTRTEGLTKLAIDSFERRSGLSDDDPVRVS